MFEFIPRKKSNPGPHHAFDRQVFFVVERWYDTNEKPVSVRDICNKMGNLAPSTVHRSLTRLMDMGYIRRDAQGVLRLTDKRWKD
jgi:DNA-binding IclR family transcriptional regulator